MQKSRKNKTEATKNLFKIALLTMSMCVILILITHRLIFQKKADYFNANLSLPRSVQVAPNGDFGVPVILSTDGANIRGVDVKIYFDQNKLELIDVIPAANTNTSLKTYLPSVAQIIAEADRNSTIEFSFITVDAQKNITSSFRGATILANLSFHAKVAGVTDVVFDFSRNSSTESNMILAAKPARDILSRVENLTVNIKSDSKIQPSATPIATSTLTLTPVRMRGLGENEIGMRHPFSETTPEIPALKSESCRQNLRFNLSAIVSFIKCIIGIKG